MGNIVMMKVILTLSDPLMALLSIFLSVHIVLSWSVSYQAVRCISRLAYLLTKIEGVGVVAASSSVAST